MTALEKIQVRTFWPIHIEHWQASGQSQAAWLFSDTPAGARASAIHYSLIETAKANGLGCPKQAFAKIATPRIF